MFARLTRMSAGFVAVLAVYWLYALIAVPIIEPTVEVSEQTLLTAAEKAQIRDAPRAKHAFAKFFKPGDWEIEGTPKVLESPQAKLIVKEYNTLPDGRMKLYPCTVIFFPKPGKKDAVGEEQAIIMKAPEGAILQFDEAFDLKRAKIGKLIGGKLNGKITIYSAPSRPDSDEDLLIVTRDVELLEDRAWTPHPVDFRMGKNRGSGREMRINLAKSEDGAAARGAVQIGEVESFELMRDVKLHVQMEPGETRGGLFANGKKQKTVGEPIAQNSKQPEPPVEVTCQGPFKFDVKRSLATFTDQVDVLRIHPEGPSDQLTCELLAIQFGPRERVAKRRDVETTTGKKAGRKVEREKSSDSKAKSNTFDIEPRRVEAVGDPVVIRAPSQGGHARCQRLEYEIKSGRIVLEGSQDIDLHQGSNQLRTPRLDYRPGENGRLGWLDIAGPGWLQGAMENEPGKKYQAQWSKELRMRPQDQTQVVSIVGAAKVRYSEMGVLAADEIHVWLLEEFKLKPKKQNAGQLVTVNYAPGSIKEVSPLPQDNRNQPTRLPATIANPAADQKELTITPDRMMASGNVTIDSPQLTGGTRRLEVMFQQASAESADAESAADSRSSTGLKRRPGERTPTQTFDVRGDLVRLQLLMLEQAEQRKTVTHIHDVTIEGGARLIETKTKKAGDEPLVVQGDRLQVAQADSDEAQVNVSGKPATVEARGLALVGAKINLDRATNRLWIDGPGRMRLPVDRDMNGKALPQPQTMDIDWQGGMQFDGKTVVYDRGVTARGEHQSLKADSVEVSLQKRIDFNNPQMPDENKNRLPPVRGGDAGQSANVEQLTCRGGVSIQNKTFDEKGQLSVDQMQMREITINQVTGVIQGRGPGWITSVRRGSPGGTPGLGVPKATPSPADKPKKDGLAFLNVRFEGPIGGNVHRQELSFSDQVRAVYGPVDDWREELDPDVPDKLKPGAVLLNSDQLIVRQMPALTRDGDPTAEMEAIGNALVEGETFTARTHKLSYSQAKNLLVLEGNGTTDAQIFGQPQPGGHTPHTAAQRILIWLTESRVERVEVDNARVVDLGNIGSGKPGKPSTGGFPNLFDSSKDKKEPAGPDARRSPRGNGTALPSLQR